jgi:S-adenosylmethionine:tRNA ribosyltransferase-isomerase
MIARPAVGFEVPAGREAVATPEDRGIQRDGVRLLVSGRSGDEHRVFSDLPSLLEPGDLLVVNESATIPASLPAVGSPGSFRLQLSTQYGRDLWLTEPRWGPGSPGPIPLVPGEAFRVAGLPARWVAGYPGIPRLGYVQIRGDLPRAVARHGRPIRYGYLQHEYPLEAYQTVFARVPGSAEMPSAARPFTPALVRALAQRGVGITGIVLHAGVSSLELDPSRSDLPVPVYPEPFEVPARTADAVRRTRLGRGRVIAVGTTVLRALESALQCGGVQPARGFTRLYLSPQHPARSVDGLLTGLHTATSTHLALLSSLVGAEILDRSYRAALAGEYLWHEFGDSQLLLPGEARWGGAAG